MKTVHSFQSTSQGKPSYVFEVDGGYIVFGQDVQGVVCGRDSVLIEDIEAFIEGLRKARDNAAALSGVDGVL